MSDVHSSSAPEQTDEGGTWFGHPRGLFYCFFAEMWERFCFYGMRNVLVLYMVSYFMYSDSDAQGGVYAAYTALIYCVAIFGGFIADKYLGYRTSILMGGVQMAAGMTLFLVNNEVTSFIGFEISRAVEDLFFYGGMALIIVGNGFFKPNISTIVGKLYRRGDPRRDGGFTIFYMGINVGALAGGIVCAEIGERVSWPLGFSVAAIGMLAGTLTFGSGGARRAMQGHGEARNEELKRRSFPIILVGSLLLVPVFYFLLQNAQLVGYALGLTAVVIVGILVKVALNEKKEQREQIFALLVLCLFNPVFWAFFEQAGSSLTLYADRHVNKSFLGIFPEIASGTVQQFNAFYIIVLAPVFAWLWTKLARIGREPSIPTKFALGLGQMGLGYLVLVLGARMFAPEDTPIIFVAGLYLLFTTGELCLSPVGLSMVTKLAPERMTGMVMGAWFLSIAGANFIAGQVASLTGAGEATGDEAVTTIESYTDIYMTVFWFVMGVTLLLGVLVPLLKKWMHGVK